LLVEHAQDASRAGRTRFLGGWLVWLVMVGVERELELITRSWRRRGSARISGRVRDHFSGKR
jgi:hypothetical protein